MLLGFEGAFVQTSDMDKITRAALGHTGMQPHRNSSRPFFRVGCYKSSKGSTTQPFKSRGRINVIF